MSRLIALVAAVTTSATLLGATATPARAATSAGAYYRAVPVAQPKAGTLITRSTLWKCDGGACSAPRAGSRDAVVCELAVQRLGALSEFHANGTAFDAAQLERCNARAKA